MGQRYSYTIGRVGAANELQGGTLNITDQSRFVGIGFQASDFSVTSDGAGLIHLNFTPVPEPGTVLLVGAAGLGLAAGRRRLLRRGRSLPVCSPAPPPRSGTFRPGRLSVR